MSEPNVHFAEVEAVLFGRHPQEGPQVQLHATDMTVTIASLVDGRWRASGMTWEDENGVPMRQDISADLGTTEDLLELARMLVESERGDFDPSSN